MSDTPSTWADVGVKHLLQQLLLWIDQLELLLPLAFPSLPGSDKKCLSLSEECVEDDDVDDDDEEFAAVVNDDEDEDDEEDIGA